MEMITPRIRRFALITLLVGGGAALAVACGEENMMGGGDDTVASVQVSPGQASVTVGGTSEFSASAQNADGESVNTSFTWSSTNTSVATVDGQGVATGQQAGNAMIVATAEGVADSADLEVTEPASASSLEKVSGGGQYGVTTRSYANSLVVEARDDNGDPVSGVTISWTVASGDASLSSSSTTTGSDGRAEVDVTAGTSTGPVTVEASADGAQGSPVSFDLDTSVALVLVGDNFFEDPSGSTNRNASVSIATGDTVMWEWQGSNPHTVTSDSSPSGGMSFDSGTQSSGTFRFAPQTTGTWTYFCEVHPNSMTGSEIEVTG